MKDHMGVEAEEEASIPFLLAPQPGIKRTGLDRMDGSGTHNNGSDRVGGAITGMEHGSVRVDCRSCNHVVFCFSHPPLCDCYRSPDPEFGPRRNRSYLEAVRETLGKEYPPSTRVSFLLSFLILNLFRPLVRKKECIGMWRLRPNRLLRDRNCLHYYYCYQHEVYSQPLFAVIENWIAEKYPENRFLNKNLTYKFPWLPGFQLNLLRLCFRSIYVVSTTAIAVMFPYFNQAIGLVGGFGFWPLTVYFPVEMYFKQKNIEAWTIKWIMLRAFSVICFLVTAFALIGSVEWLMSARLSQGSKRDVLRQNY
ncbi:hypothetical protein POTOM_040292 [Populus tomentosa]|uniref:Amino acid transporter transmembrane domain-containing protein n=1 Tax=Populus tomentosa TaxID=118781 RepID=A0A8X8CK94_POPTO|nr:hypothetical protein POTOM_040292 [Populus tomentosa]